MGKLLMFNFARGVFGECRYKKWTGFWLDDMTFDVYKLGKKNVFILHFYTKKYVGQMTFIQTYIETYKQSHLFAKTKLFKSGEREVLIFCKFRIIEKCWPLQCFGNESAD